MRKLRFKKTVCALTASVLLLASCGGVGAPPASSGPAASSGKLTSQSLPVPSTGFINGIVHNSIMNDAALRQAIQELGLYGSLQDLIDWENSRQIIEDRSDMWEDRFDADVYITLKADFELTFRGSYHYLSGGNSDGHTEYGSINRAMKIHTMNSRVLFSDWDITNKRISTWLVESNNMGAQSLTMQSLKPETITALSSSAKVLAEDIDVPTSVRPAKISMLLKGTVLSGQSIIVNPVTPECKDGTAGGGINSQAILVNPAPNICAVTPPCPEETLYQASTSGIQQLSADTYCFASPKAPPLAPINCTVPQYLIAALEDAEEDLRRSEVDLMLAQNGLYEPTVAAAGGGAGLLIYGVKGACKGTTSQGPAAWACVGGTLLLVVTGHATWNQTQAINEMKRRVSVDKKDYVTKQNDISNWERNAGCR